MSRKQLIILFIGAVGFLLIFVIFLAFQQSSTTTAPKIKAGVTPLPTASVKLEKTGDGGYQEAYPTATPPPQQNLTAAQTVQMFYNATAGINPLANGAYKNNPYLSGTFMRTIASGYKNGNTPVFCPENRRPQVSIGKEQQVYYAQGYLTQETITEASTGKDLYLVMLENDDNAWKIFDITCL